MNLRRIMGMTLLLILSSTFLLLGQEAISVRIESPTAGESLNVRDTITLVVENCTRAALSGGQVALYVVDEASNRTRLTESWVTLDQANVTWLGEEADGRARVTFEWVAWPTSEPVLETGIYGIYAKLFCGSAGTFSSPIVNSIQLGVDVQDDDLPSDVRIISPANNTQVARGARISIQIATTNLVLPLAAAGVVITGPDGEIVTIEQLSDSSSLNSATLSINWLASEPAGVYELHALVQDAMGRQVESSKIKIVIDGPPIPTGNIFIEVDASVVLDPQETSPTYASEIQRLISFSIRTEPADLANHLRSFKWRLGDGTSKEVPSFSHAYSVDRSYIVSLKAYTESGFQGQEYEASITINVAPIQHIIVTREIIGIPSIEKDEMQIMPDCNLRVRLQIEIQHEVHVVTLREQLPVGWTLLQKSATAPSMAALKVISRGPLTNASGSVWEWVITEQLSPGQLISIEYVLQSPPPGSAPGLAKLAGTYGIGFGTQALLEQPIGGQSSINLVAALPIEVAIAHIVPDDAESPIVPYSLEPTISDAQIAYVEELWQESLVVPHTGGAELSMEIFLDLLLLHQNQTVIAYPYYQRD